MAPLVVARLAAAATVVSVVVAAIGCYAPAAREGAPCGAGAVCPTGQQCDAQTLRCTATPGLVDAARGADADATLPGDAPPDAATNLFVDTFARADSAAIGNGWIEKNPVAFSIAGGEVTRVDTTPQSYRDNLVYRPAAENLLDVEVSLRVRFAQLPPRFPQVFVRARTATITATDSYDGYLLYVAGSAAADQVVLGRQLGMPFVVTLSQFTLSEPFTTTDRYRLTLRAQGTSPVALEARVEKLVGTAWTTIGSTSVSDTAPERISDPGTVGFSGDEIPSYVYGEFRRTAL